MRARTPCVVLLDMHMPFIDGWEFRRHQLRDPKCAAVPILAVTAHYDPHEVERKLCVRCLQKPISIDYVITEVERACDAQRQGGAMEHGPFARLGVR
jgi:CheY-like chemotaxis protein